jgi:formylglycine-generating enzyme required for sulfatase activity
MVWISGGVSQMGSDRHYPEEAPESRVRVDGFFIDPYLVSNRKFAAFEALVTLGRLAALSCGIVVCTTS